MEQVYKPQRLSQDLSIQHVGDETLIYDERRHLAFCLNRISSAVWERCDGAHSVRQIAEAVVRLNQSKKQHPILICDEAQLLPHPALEQLPLLLNFDMDSSRYLTLLLIGQPLLRRTLSLQLHEALRQRIGVHYHLEGVTRQELDAYLIQQLKAAGIAQPLFDENARQALYQATRGILRFFRWSRGSRRRAARRVCRRRPVPPAAHPPAPLQPHDARGARAGDAGDRRGL